MKIAIISTGPKIDDSVGTVPDSSPYWLFVDLETMKCEAMPNPLTSIGGPAKLQLIIQVLHNSKVKYILAGGYGTIQLKELEKNGIKVLFGLKGSVRKTVEKFHRQNCILAPYIKG